MKYCIKWFCGGEMQAHPVRTFRARGVHVTVTVRKCPKCGFAYQDYEIETAPKRGKAVTK